MDTLAFPSWSRRNWAKDEFEASVERKKREAWEAEESKRKEEEERKEREKVEELKKQPKVKRSSRRDKVG